MGRAPVARTDALRMAASSNKDVTSTYWEGEWVCADCGYIYDIDDCGGLYLEQQVRSLNHVANDQRETQAEQTDDKASS